MNEVSIQERWRYFTNSPCERKHHKKDIYSRVCLFVYQAESTWVYWIAVQHQLVDKSSKEQCFWTAHMARLSFAMDISMDLALVYPQISVFLFRGFSVLFSSAISVRVCLSLFPVVIGILKCI